MSYRVRSLASAVVELSRFLVYGNREKRKSKRMNRLLAFFNTREPFAHKRILAFWLVALVALALPWLWFALTDREAVPGGAGGPVAVELRETRH